MFAIHFGEIANKKIICFEKFGCATHGSRKIVFYKYARASME